MAPLVKEYRRAGSAKARRHAFCANYARHSGALFVFCAYGYEREVRVAEIRAAKGNDAGNIGGGCPARCRGAERGVRAEAEAKRQLKSAYRTVIDEAEPERKYEAGRDLIRAIYGKDSIAEHSILRSSAWRLASPAPNHG